MRRCWLALRSRALREQGWIEGSNLTLDVRSTLGDAARIAPLTTDLLALQPDVFVVTADFMAEPAAAATKLVPIVFIVGADPVARGLVKTLARPGGNVTGLATQDSELYPKRLALMKEAIPGLSKVGVLVSSLNVGPVGALTESADASRKLGLVLVPALIDRPDDLEPAFERLALAGAKGVVDYAIGSVTYAEQERVAALAIKHRIAMLGLPSVADSGVLLTYGYDIAALVRRAASLVDRILRGVKPADIPVEQVNVFELVVNLRTARALSIELPRSLLLRANRVIE